MASASLLSSRHGLGTDATLRAVFAFSGPSTRRKRFDHLHRGQLDADRMFHSRRSAISFDIEEGFTSAPFEFRTAQKNGPGLATADRSAQTSIVTQCDPPRMPPHSRYRRRVVSFNPSFSDISCRSIAKKSSRRHAPPSARSATTRRSRSTGRFSKRIRMTRESSISRRRRHDEARGYRCESVSLALDADTLLRSTPGSVHVTNRPPPSRFSIRIWPPWASRISRQSARPSPVPRSLVE
jgi:hypothetical protein